MTIMRLEASNVCLVIIIAIYGDLSNHISIDVAYLEHQSLVTATTVPIRI